MSVLERVRSHEGGVSTSISPQRIREAKLKMKSALVERLGLGAMASMVRNEAEGQARQELAVACQAILNTSDFEGISSSERYALVQEVLDEIVGLGPLQPLIDDDSVSEVMVNGCASLYFERKGVLYPARRVFESREQILMVVDRILSPLGRRVDERSPIVNARLSNGYRVNVVISPVALEGPIVTIRKFSDRISSLSRLVELGSLPAWYAQLLSWAVQARQNIAVVGGTGSGKTTLLNALSSEIDAAERVITIEDSAELKFERHPHVVRLESREASIEGSGAITIRDLVINALRMRPDRIVVGEVRGAECIDMLQAMNTGHDGSLTTLHAGSEQEAIIRLILMARFGMDLPAAIIEEQVSTALDLIVMSERLADGSRVVSSCSTVSRTDEGSCLLEECVAFDEAERRWSLLQRPPFLAHAIAKKLIDEKEVQQWSYGLSQ